MSIRGEYVAPREIKLIKEIVDFLPLLSRAELAKTICVQLDWLTPAGTNRLAFALRVLERLDRRGILTLPAKQQVGRGRQKPLQLDHRTDRPEDVDEPLSELEPLQSKIARTKAEVELWNHWMERYHPLGYRQPIGAHLRYSVIDHRGRLLSSLLIDFATRRLPCRDKWIGWASQDFRNRLHLVVRNSRFIIFPWVRVKNLASRVLGLVARQLPDDWDCYHGYRPVLMETFVNPRQQRATSYKAANWEFVGMTSARGKRGRVGPKRPKEVWALPLDRQWRKILMTQPPRSRR